MKVRNVALKKYHQFPSGHYYSEYKKIRNAVVDLVRQDEDAYRKKVLKGFKGQPKRFYGHMRQLQTIKGSVNVLIKPYNSLTENDQEVVNLLGKVFSDSFTSETMDDGVIHREAKLSDWQDSYVDISKEAVLTKSLKLKDDKSPGPDGIRPIVLKSCAEAVADPLSRIYLESFDSGIIPNDWKTATITPIFRKGSRSDLSNYRPVLLTMRQNSRIID